MINTISQELFNNFLVFLNKITMIERDNRRKNAAAANGHAFINKIKHDGRRAIFYYSSRQCCE